MIEFINYFVCFVFGAVTGCFMSIAMLIVLLKEKPHHGP
jgi:hypothetical protein